MSLSKKLLLCLVLLVLPALAPAQVDLNRADAKMLAEAMTGVGLVKAEAIVAYRNAHGPFRRVEDLGKVKGIGAKTIDANRGAVVVVDGGESEQPPLPVGAGRPRSMP